MATERQVGIRMTLDATSVTTQLPRVERDFARLGTTTDATARQATRNVSQVTLSFRDLVAGAAGLTVVASAVRAVTSAITALPTAGFNFTRELEVSQMGMAGVLGSMTAINGQQTTFHQGLAISSQMVQKLNDDALRTAATSQELVTVFQALLAPGLSARMTLDEVRQLTVVGTNAVKSMGLAGHQVVQELRDLVAGGITPASSTLATALGLKDADIAQARASSEGLFNFLMKRLEGFSASADAFGSTITGKLDQLREGATRVAADGMQPLTEAIKEALDGTSGLFQTLDSAGKVQLNPQLVQGIREFAEGGVVALRVGRDVVSSLWEHRDAIQAVLAAYAGMRTVQWGQAVLAQWRATTAAAAEAQAATISAQSAAAASAASAAAIKTQEIAAAQQKAAALMAEARAQQVSQQAAATLAASQLAQLQATREAIVLSRAEVVAKLDAARATMAQAEAQINAARAAGAQSFALATLRSGTAALTAAQTQHAALIGELAVLGQQQARVSASITAATTAQTAATNAATAATVRLQTATASVNALQAASVATSAAATAGVAKVTLAKNAASLAAKGFGFALAAVGGPAGIFVAAAAGVATWLWNIRSRANDAEKSLDSMRLAMAALDKGSAVRSVHITSIEASLEAARDEVDRLTLNAPKIKPDPLNRPLVNAANAREMQAYQQSLDAANGKVREYEKLLERARASTVKADASTAGLALSLDGTRQAWQRANEDVKTASSVQEEYTRKLQASRSAFATYRKALEESGAGTAALSAADKRQKENEAGLAKERNDALKNLRGSQAAVNAAEKDGFQARVEAIKQGQQLLSLQIADGMDAIEAQRAAEQLSEFGAIQARRTLQLQDIANREDAVRRELELVRKRKDTLQEQAKLEGDLRELAQQRTNINNKADREGEAALTRPLQERLNAVRQATEAVTEQAIEQERANQVYGKAKSALLELTIANNELKLAEVDRANAIPGYVEALQNQIAAQKRLLEATKKGEALDIAEEVRKKQVDAAQRTSEDIRGIFRTGFVDALDEKGGVLVSMATALKRTVATSIADALYDSLLKQAVDGFAASIGNSVRNSLANTSGNGGGGLLSGLSSLLGNVVNYFFPGSAAAPAAAASSSTVMKAAKGNVFSSSDLHRHVNTVVDRSTFFRFARGGAFGEMGEAGPEAIMPLKRDSQGRLGVVAQGGKSGGVEVHVHNNGQPATVRAEQSQTAGGGLRLDLFLERIDEYLGGQIGGGAGATARSIESRYGLSTAVN